MSKNAKKQLRAVQREKADLPATPADTSRKKRPFDLPESVKQLDPVWQFVVRFLLGHAMTTPDAPLRKALYRAAKEVDMGRVAVGLPSAVFDLGMKPASRVRKEATVALAKGMTCPVCDNVVKSE